MLSRDAKFAVAASTIALASLIISAVVLRNVSERQAAITGRLQRIGKLQDEMLRVQFMANEEMNYSALYLSFYELHQDNPRANVMMEGAGKHFYNSYLMSTMNTYREGVPEGLEDLVILQTQLQKASDLFKQNFSAAVAQTASIREAITREKMATNARIINERNTLQLERERLGRRESGVQFIATSIQFLSILLVLIKDVFKPKKAAA